MSAKKEHSQKREMEEFLREYKRHEVLWNPALPNYSQKKAREDALQEIAQTLNVGGIAQVKRRIHTIRSTYNQIRLKVMEAEAAGRVYTPQLSWYKSASFLSPVITLRKNRDSLNSTYKFEPVEDMDTSKSLTTVADTYAGTSASEVEDIPCDTIEVVQMAPESAVTIPESRQSKDEIALFCDLMDSQLRTLPQTMVLECMCQIQTMVKEARLQNMRHAPS